MARASKARTSKTDEPVKAPGPASPATGVEEATGLSAAVLDEILSLQLLVAWAGEGVTEPPRLGWWRTSLVDEFGGADLFKRLTPRTWKWSVLEAARVAARMADAETRSHAADGDLLISLFHFGFAIDEQLEDRLADLKRAASDPLEVLPLLAPTAHPWDSTTFRTQMSSLAEVATSPSSVGVRLKGAMPSSPELVARALAAAMASRSERYPAPHWKVDA